MIVEMFLRKIHIKYDNNFYEEGRNTYAVIKATGRSCKNN